jgi:ABC-type phosphate transport system substrate-binding protein
LVLVAAALLAMADQARADEAPAFVIIAHAGVKAQGITKADARALFTKKTTRWSNDVPVTPFDLVPTSPVRAAFSTSIHGKSPQAVLSEWRQRIFTGQGTPPREVKDDPAMIAAVAATPGALGYVKAGTPLPPQVHAIAVSD